MQLLPLLAVMLLLFFMNKQQRRRAKAQADLVNALQPGATVMTTAGIFGVVRGNDTESIHLEIAPGTVVRVAKGAIGRLAEPASGAGPGGPAVPANDRDLSELPAPTAHPGSISEVES